MKGLPQIGRHNVAALIPAYFEARSIGDVARRTLAQVDHVLVLDDGSTDGTSTEALKGGAEVIRHASNLGKGAAIKSGLKALSARPDLEYIIMLDGDGQHLPEEIPHFLHEANRAYPPMIVGNRMGDVKKMPFVRKLTNRWMSSQISSVCGQRVPDTQCGFRMVRCDIAPILAECATSGFDYETEMLVIASRHQCRIASVPVSTVYGEETSKIHPIRDTRRFLQLMRRLKREAASL